MKKQSYGGKTIYGITTLGEKGQVVIPAHARKAMRLEKGEKLLVIGMGNDVISFSKLSSVEAFASELAKRLETMHEIIQPNKKLKRR